MNKKYILDTNICIFYFKKQANILKKIKEVGLDNCFVSEITIAELLYGAEKSTRQKHFDEVDALQKSIESVCVFDTLGTYAKLRVGLEKIGQKIDDFDLLIASAAINYDMVLVTDNIKHFGRIPNLKIENWMR